MLKQRVVAVKDRILAVPKRREIPVILRTVDDDSNGDAKGNRIIEEEEIKNNDGMVRPPELWRQQ